MNEFDLSFHHLGLAVRSVDAAVKFLVNSGYICSEAIADDHQCVNLVFCRHAAMPDVELIYPANEPGPIDSILSAHSELIYHICYTTRDRDASLYQMKMLGHRVRSVADPAPAPLFDGRQVSFHMVKGFGLIELLDEY